MKLNIPPLSQRDSRWASKKLGTSTVSTIGGYGCLLTCASMVCKYFGKDTDPSRLNDEMVKAKGFTNGDLWLWGQLSLIYPDITFDWDVYNQGSFYDLPCDLTLIDKLLALKLPVIVQVDFMPGGDVQEHWVLIKGKEGDYIINDPYFGEEYFFTAKYGDPSRYIFAVRVYRGEVSNEPTIEDQLSDCKIKTKSLEENVATLQLEVGAERSAKEAQERDNKDLTDQLIKSRSERDTAIREKTDTENSLKKANEEVESLKKAMDVLSIENTDLKSALAGCTSLKIADISTKILYSELFYRLFHRK